jgi:hypothetical protein
VPLETELHLSVTSRRKIRNIVIWTLSSKWQRKARNSLLRPVVGGIRSRNSENEMPQGGNL